METTGYTYTYLSASMYTYIILYYIILYHNIYIYIYLPTYMQRNDVHGHSRMANIYRINKSNVWKDWRNITWKL